MKPAVENVNSIFVAMQRHLNALLKSVDEINCTEKMPVCW